MAIEISFVHGLLLIQMNTISPCMESVFPVMKEVKGQGQEKINPS